MTLLVVVGCRELGGGCSLSARSLSSAWKRIFSLRRAEYWGRERGQRKQVFRAPDVRGAHGGAMTDAAATHATGEVALRPVEPADAPACAQIVFEAFGAIHDHHRFQRDFPAIEAAAGVLD